MLQDRFFLSLFFFKFVLQDSFKDGKGMIFPILQAYYNVWKLFNTVIIGRESGGGRGFKVRGGKTCIQTSLQTGKTPEAPHKTVS